MEKKKFLVLRNYTIEPIFNEIKNKFHFKNYHLNFKFSGYDSVLADLLKIKENNFKKYDGVLIFLSPESLLKKNSNDLTNKYIELATEITDFLFNKNIKNVFFFYFNSQNFLNLNISDKHLFKLNKFYLNLKKKNISTINLSEELKLFTNTNNYYDKKFWQHAMFPFNGNGLKIISNIIYLKIKNIIGLSYKTIILDADNTLWNGIIDEVGVKKINFLNKKKNINYLTFHKNLKLLKNSGFLLCLCSKNNISNIKKTFLFHKKKMGIRLSDFIIVKSNWEPKIKNIKEIHKELNLSIDNSIFLDDSIFEIESVNSLMPSLDTINVLEFENFSANIYKLINHISNKSKNTKEDKNRIKLYNEEFKRNKEKVKFNNFEDYIKSLKIKLNIKKNSKKDLQRLSQLTLRTNQFNSNNTRLGINDVKKLFKEKKFIIYQCSAHDKYGDYGVIGLSILKLEEHTAKMISFIMSCRALGREIEKYFFNFIRLELKKKYSQIKILYKKTSKNKLVETFFNKNCKKIKLSNQKIYYIIKTNFKDNNKKLIKIINEK